MKLFRHHSRSKPCHSLLVRLTCDCKDTAIISVLPNRDCRRESCTLFRVLRHHTPSPRVYLSEERRKPCTLSHVFLLSCEGKSIVRVKEKAPSHSAFPLSMYVVLKTRQVNPNIHVRRPNLFTTRPQLFIPTQSNGLIEVTSLKLYSFLHHPNIALPTLPYIHIRAPHTYFSPQALCLARVHYII